MNSTSKSTPATSRDWPMYMLKTLIVLAVVAVWLQSQVSTVRERESLIKAGGVGWGVSAQNPPGIPWVWSLLGARQFNLIHMDNDVFSEQDVSRYQAAFPEAEVVLGSPEYFRDPSNLGKLMRKYRSPPEIDPKNWAHASN
jgi:hypothetical protein